MVGKQLSVPSCQFSVAEPEVRDALDALRMITPEEFGAAAETSASRFRELRIENRL